MDVIDVLFMYIMILLIILLICAIVVKSYQQLNIPQKKRPIDCQQAIVIQSSAA